MRHLFIVIGLCFGSLSMLPCCAKTESARVVLINTHKVLEGSHAFRKFQVMLEMKGKEAEKKFLHIQKELEKKNNTLVSLQSTLPEKQWKERKSSFDKEVADFQKQVQEQRALLEEMHQKAILELQGHVQHVLSKLSEKKGFSLTLDQQVIIWAGKDIDDVTEEVITLLNERISDLSFKGDCHTHKEGHKNP